MSRSEWSRPGRVAILVAAMIGILAVTGCGAGQITQTGEQITAVGGANVGTGTILVRDAQITFGDEVKGGTVHPRGGTAPLQMRIINEGTTGDRLVSASSPVASSVQVTGQAEVPAGQVLLVGGEPTAPVAPAPVGRLPGAAATTTTPATTTPLPATPATTSPATTSPLPATPATTTPLPATSATTSPATTSPATTTPAPAAQAPVEGGERTAQIVLTGLRDDIRAGLTYELVLVFERAGEIRFDIPVGNPQAPREPAAE
ncbi:MAG: hypothetical protein ACRDRK_19735 [Pseudonocardia sp.]